MRLSALEEYGIRCLMQVARLQGDGTCRIPDIAAAEGLSQEYTAKLMRVLRQGELVISFRGASGGYRLVRPAVEITMWDALRVLDGPLFSNTFCIHHTGQRADCVHSDDCNLATVWQWLGGMIETALRAITLADLTASGAGIAQRLQAAGPLATSGGCSGGCGHDGLPSTLQCVDGLSSIGPSHESSTQGLSVPGHMLGSSSGAPAMATRAIDEEAQ